MKSEIRYLGRMYKVQKGTRGGHFIMVKGDRKYVKSGPKKPTKKKPTKKKGLRMSNFKLFGGAPHMCILDGMVFPLNYVQKTLKAIPGNCRARMVILPDGGKGDFGSMVKKALEENPTWMWRVQLIMPLPFGFKGKRLGPFPPAKPEHYTESPNFSGKIQTNVTNNGKTVQTFSEPIGVGSELVENQLFKDLGLFVGQSGACVDMTKYSEGKKFIIGGLITEYTDEKNVTIHSNSDIDSVTSFYYNLKKELEEKGETIFGRNMVYDTAGEPAMKYYRQIFDVSVITVEGENFLIVSFNPANSKPLIMPSNYQVCTYIYSLDTKYSNLKCEVSKINVTIQGFKLDEGIFATPILHSDILEGDIYTLLRGELKKHLEAVFTTNGWTYYDISDQKQATVSMNQSHFHGFGLLNNMELAEHITLKSNVTRPASINSRGRTSMSNPNKFKSNGDTYEGYLNANKYKRVNNATGQKLINNAKKQLNNVEKYKKDPSLNLYQKYRFNEKLSKDPY